MKKFLVSCTILLLALSYCMAAASGGADLNSANWSKGNDFFKKKSYDSAAAYYEKIAVQRPHNAEVYYNLGNAYYRLNKIGFAVLNYERALQINPDYTEAKENLILTRSRIPTHIPQTGDIFFIAWWDALTRADRATTWAVWGLVLFLSAIGISMLMYFKKGGMRIPPQVPGILGFAWLCMMVLAYNAAQNYKNCHLAVVMQNDAPLMNLEQKGGKPMSLIPEGTTVKISALKGEFAEVTLPDGRKGWVEQTWLNKV